MNERIRRRGFDGICAGLIAAAIATGCASARPMANTKVSQAGRAVDEAHQAGATTSASMDLKMAEDKLKDAQAASRRVTTSRRAVWRISDSRRGLCAGPGDQSACHQDARRDEAEHPGVAPRARTAPQ